MGKVERGERLYSSVNLTYPIAHVGSGYTLHLERNFFGVRLEEGDAHRRPHHDSNHSIDPLSVVTPIRYVEVIMMNFRGDIMRPGDEERMNAWEMRVGRGVGRGGLGTGGF